MLFLFLFVIAIVVMVVGFYGDSNSTSHGDSAWVGAIVCGMSAAIVLFIVTIIMVAVAYTDTVNDRAKIKATYSNAAVLETRAKDIGSVLRDYLVTQYPQYEQSTITKIVNSGPDLIILRFPELKAADTFIKYSSEYSKLRSSIYNQTLKRNSIQARYDGRRNNHLIFLYTG